MFSPEVRRRLRLLHYWWPVLMGVSFVMVAQRALAKPADPNGFALLLAGILAAYSVDRLLDTKDPERDHWLRRRLLIAAVAAILAGLVLVGRMPFRTALLVPTLGALVLWYPRLKALPALKTLLVAGVWTWASLALPFTDGSWLGWKAWAAPVAIPLALVIASGCVLCDLKDTQADRVASVRSLPVVIGLRGAVVTAIGLALVGATLAIFEQRLGLGVAGLGLALAATRPNALSQDAIGPLIVDAILTVPGVLIGLRIV